MELTRQKLRLTVATSILAELSFGISHMKLSNPSSVHSGMSCHAETSLPPALDAESLDWIYILDDFSKLSMQHATTFVSKENSEVSGAHVTLGSQHP